MDYGELGYNINYAQIGLVFKLNDIVLVGTRVTDSWMEILRSF